MINEEILCVSCDKAKVCKFIEAMIDLRTKANHMPRAEIHKLEIKCNQYRLKTDNFKIVGGW